MMRLDDMICPRCSGPDLEFDEVDGYRTPTADYTTYAVTCGDCGHQFEVDGREDFDDW